MYHPMGDSLQQDFADSNARFSMFGAFTAAAANLAANFGSCPASTSICSSSQFGASSIPAIVSTSSASSSGGSIPSLAALGNAPGKRERTKYSEYQLAYLDSVFRESNYPDAGKREEIARLLQLTDVKVQVWFKNRRAKNRNEKKFEQMKREAAKVAASRKGHGNLVKREESVEDTEEEDQGKGAKLEAGSGPKSNGTKRAPGSGCGKNDPVALPMPEAQPHSLLPFYQVPKMENGAFGQWPSQFGANSAEMGSLMQMAASAAFPPPSAHQAAQNFYSGWANPSAINQPSSLLASQYPASQMFGQLTAANNAAAAAVYYPTGHYNYYFPQQTTAEPD